jgi:hypothetical protein
MKSTVKIGSKNSMYVQGDDDIRTSSPKRRLKKKSSMKKKKSIHTPNHQNMNRLHVDADDDAADIVSVSNELSFHRRCYPLTPYVVDDDDEEEVNHNGLHTEPQYEVWNNGHRQHVPITTTATMNVSEQQQQQSWIVSLSNRAIHFTELVRPPNDNHPIAIQQPTVNHRNNTRNDIYLVDDDQDDVDDDDDDATRFFDSYIDL